MDPTNDDVVDRFRRSRRWFSLHVAGLVTWAVGLAVGVGSGQLSWSIPGWLALSGAGIAGMIAGRSILVPRGYNMWWDADPGVDDNMWDGHRTTLPVQLTLVMITLIGAGVSLFILAL